jgi:hypothetical protein
MKSFITCVVACPYIYIYREREIYIYIYIYRIKKIGLE